MRRLSFLFQIVFLVLIGCGVYRTANQYEGIEKQVAGYDAQDAEEQENIRVLQAEWAFLNTPSRLEKIGRDYFQLQPVDGSQTVAINDIPVRAALDAQEDKQVADNTDAKPVAPQKSLPPTVTPVAAANTTTVATAMPQALPQAAQTLPPIPVSATTQDEQ